MIRTIAVACILVWCQSAAPAQAPKRGPTTALDAERLRTVTTMLGGQPTGVGRPAAERAAWGRLAADARYGDVVETAAKLLTQPLPDQPDDLYLDFSRTGNRTRWQKVASQRRGRLTTLVLAECLENHGRFLPAIESLIAALCSERTWVMPAHDRRLTDFNGTFIDVDLGSSALAWNLATADWLLGNRLNPATRKMLRALVHRFVLDPCLAAYRGTRNIEGWMKTTSNWNAVCLAGVRSWFGDAGILIARPAPGTACRMGVALKGGHNAEHHNHNDLGSYVVIVGNQAVLLDPGGETYTARTFSAQRYDSKLLNSLGHPVPLVAGKLQRSGRDAQAKVLRAELTDRTDTLELDLTSGYLCADLKRLKRTFVYSREGAGSLAVSDRVEFASPQSFGTALITQGSWERTADGSLQVRTGNEAVRVEIFATGGEYALQAEEIREDAPVQPTRLGINFTKPVTAATITLKIRPSGSDKP